MSEPKRISPWTGAAVLAAAAALGACHLEPLEQQDPIELVTHHTFDHANWQQIPPVVESQVESITVAHAVEFAPSETELSEAAWQSLFEFLQNSGAAGGARIEIDGPRISGDYFDARTLARLEGIRAELAEIGLQSEIPARPLPLLARPDGKILVAVTRAMVILPDCSTPAPSVGQRPGYVWSCASAAGLGLTVADPLDLARGRDPGPADGAAGVLAIQRYREGKITPPVDPGLQ